MACNSLPHREAVGHIQGGLGGEDTHIGGRTSVENERAANSASIEPIPRSGGSLLAEIEVVKWTPCENWYPVCGRDGPCYRTHTTHPLSSSRVVV